MTTVNSNVSVTLNGSTTFGIGGDTFEWFDRWLNNLDLWAPDAASPRTVTLKLTGNSWHTGLLRFSGDASVTITDLSNGTTDDNRISMDSITVYTEGTNTITLKNADVGTIVGGGSIEKVTVGYWVGYIGLGRGNDSVSVTGDGEVGNMDLGRDADTLTTSGNAWVGAVYMGRGNDKVTLGAGGADYISLGRDADTIKFAALTDKGQHVTVDGGEGITETTDKDIDTVNFSAFTSALTIDLDGQSTVKTGAGNFHIRNFENVIGGSGKDTIIASADVNVLKGGGGGDTFVFETVAAARGDKILDFTQGSDKIGLSAIDANGSAAGSAAFKFIGTAAFHDVAGELRYFQKSGDTFVQGDVNGDGTADFTLSIDALITLKSTDFIL
ncbi:M10 family metallopeptidase C-terminal domain-containing protein [Shinella sp. M27]|uniref:M10 family metallopeptidase C-terminal domain-containing protein n=1 Tax=Shinella sp. M27 TaxID=3368614 RepID=UPI003B9E300C